jgi:hypothetical protein
MLDLSKLSPMSKYRILEVLREYAARELTSYNEDVKMWEDDLSIKSDAGKELIGWRDALNDLLTQINKEKKDAK